MRYIRAKEPLLLRMKGAEGKATQTHLIRPKIQAAPGILLPSGGGEGDAHKHPSPFENLREKLGNFAAFSSILFNLLL